MAVLVAFPYAAKAQNYFQVDAKPDSNHIRIGEQVNINLSARVELGALKGAAFKVIFPIVPDSFNHIEVVDKGALDTSKSTDAVSFFSRTITVTSFDSGRWEIPPMKFEVFSITDGSYDSVFTEPFFLDVNTVQVDTTKAFKPIKNVEEVPFNLLDFLKDYWWAILIGVGVIGGIIALVIWNNKRKNKPVEVPKKPEITPYQLAMNGLMKLKQDQAWIHTDSKTYYTTLTDVLRLYFEQQFKIAALEQTSAELLQNIKPVTVLNQQKDQLRALLTLSDLAKFAKFEPTPQELEDSLQKAIGIVEWTKAAAQNAEAKENAGDNPEQNNN
ncbi:hypothetical protein LX64_02823 [Chitinophaga skermanii]|uniref:Oxygen tolerance protein BatD n=1 Tax=Chitinophaga skermanii TaxID=331697 RepID=A0A327QH52_9BACT|nr:hypothetical protein LX64_02823 [Chitinophaga skermanii]